MENLKKALAHLPHEPGVYIYRDEAKRIIYVGKAMDLSRRVKQYFQKTDALGEKTSRLVSDIASIETIPTTSEFDALLLEAKLIRSHLPKYNAVARDDKSPLYVVITLSELLPRLLLVRKRDIGAFERNRKNCVYGPFQSGYALRLMLRQLRPIVPYCIQKQRTGKACFYTHLHLCDPCPSVIVGLGQNERKLATMYYRKNMFRLKALFEGKANWLAKEYEKEMRSLAKELQFEKAAAVKERLRYLKNLPTHRYDPQIFLDIGATDIYKEELSELVASIRRFYPELTQLERIECFDISNLFGTFAVGSMVVLTDGRPDKSEYRKFRIRTVKGISDVAMMEEVLMRRFKHAEWKRADFVLVDGGRGQVEVARRVVVKLGLTLPVAGLAKREEELIIPTTDGFATVRLPLGGRAIKVLMRVRDEAHRFAITYHRSLREKALCLTNAHKN